MRRAIAVALGVLVPLLGWAGVGQAQSSVQVQGTVEAVDCQAQTVVLGSGGTSNTVAVAPYTAVLVNATSVPLCTLQQYVGAPATAWLLASGNEFVATRIDVTGQPVAAPPPAPAAASPLPIVGIVLGTIVVAGLLYLLVHGPDGHYYRYPYYGPYHRYYYRPEYRPYRGPYPSVALVPVVTVPPVLTGIVLGTVIVAGLEYLLVRDRDGRLYRYPYYGAYREHYYRPEYRPYRGPYRDAPVRQGDPRWDGPAPLDLRGQAGPGYRDPGGHAPAAGVAPPASRIPASETRIWPGPARRADPGEPAPAASRDPGTRVDSGHRIQAPAAGPPLAAPGTDRRVGPAYPGPGHPAPVTQRGPMRDPPAYERAPGARPDAGYRGGPPYRGPASGRGASQGDPRERPRGRSERCVRVAPSQPCPDGGRGAPAR